MCVCSLQPCYLLPEVEDPEKSSPLALARNSNQTLQAVSLTRMHTHAQSGTCRHAQCSSFSLSQNLLVASVIFLGSFSIVGVVRAKRSVFVSKRICKIESYIFPATGDVDLNVVVVVCTTQRRSFNAVSKKGFLFKTGSDRTGWKRRYCTLDKFRGFEYFKNEVVSVCMCGGEGGKC